MSEMVERVARALYNENHFVRLWEDERTAKLWHQHYRDHARAAIAAMREPTEAQWGGLARAIVMWMDMHPETPRALFRHLEQSGQAVPQWLRDEPEMKHLDHVPGKGTRCVLIYRAMIDAALSHPEATQHG